MVTLTQLEYIVAVEKFGNFGLAAKSCFVTQPTLSMQIQKLEEQLGVVVFDRSKQPIRATAIGQKILDQSRVVLNHAALITELINQEKEQIEGDLRLAIIPTLAPYLLPLFLHDFTQQFPKVRLFVEESKTDDIIQGLQQNQLDAGLLVTPLEEPSLTEIPLFHEPFYVYTSEKGELSHLSVVSDKDLQNQELLLLTEGHCMREQTLRICKQRNQSANKLLHFESGSIETLCHLVERGEGYTVVPHLAKTWLESRPGHIIPFTTPTPTREVSLVVHRSFVRQSILQALSNAIQRALPAELRKVKQGIKTIKIR